MKKLVAIVMLLAGLLGFAVSNRAPLPVEAPPTVVEHVVVQAPAPVVREPKVQPPKVKKPVPERERVRVKDQKKKPVAPERERKPQTSDELPVSCATVRWYNEHVSQSVLDAMERKYKPTAGQKRAARACLNGAS